MYMFRIAPFVNIANSNKENQMLLMAFDQLILLMTFDFHLEFQALFGNQGSMQLFGILYIQVGSG